jgi:hypothetical protein
MLLTKQSGRLNLRSGGVAIISNIGMHLDVRGRLQTITLKHSVESFFKQAAQKNVPS